MQLKTRQRLIGLLLLLLLAAILAPLVLRTPEQVRVALDMSIPEPPPITEPEVVPVISEREQLATDRQIDEEKQAVAKPEPAADDAPRPGFTVQVASFSDADNANALVERLRGAGYNAYHRTLVQDNNTWERVFVGPEIKREDAEFLRRRLADDKTFALDGLIRPFVP